MLLTWSRSRGVSGSADTGCRGLHRGGPNDTRRGLDEHGVERAGLAQWSEPSTRLRIHVSPGAQGYAAYAERALPENRKLAIAGNSAFSDLNFALYLGRSSRTGPLLGATVALPITGRQATSVIPFGDSAFTLVVTPKGSLVAPCPNASPRIIASGGAILALVAALVADRLVRRRQRAERLAASLDRVAAENRRLYTEQRSIAQTLQHALLPDHLPRFRRCRRLGLATCRVCKGSTSVVIGTT